MKRRTTLLLSLLLLVLLTVAAVFLIPTIKKQFYPRKYNDFISKYASEFSVPEPLVYAVIQTESDFDPDAESSVGAQGLMQLMPETFEWLSMHIDSPDSVEKINDPETNIKYGTFYLSFLYERFNNWETAVAAYNAGHGRVGNWLDDSRYSEDGTTLKNIPLSETYNYVNRVMESYEEYKKIYYNGEN